MATRILVSAGSPKQRAIINAVNPAVSSEMAEVYTQLVKLYRRRVFPVRWAPVSGGSISQAGLLIDSRLSPAAAQEQIITVMRAAKSRLNPQTNPALPNPAPVQPTPEPQAWFREEEGNLLHRESHTGLFPAEFYAVRADGLSSGLVADGECNA